MPTIRFTCAGVLFDFPVDVLAAHVRKAEIRDRDLLPWLESHRDGGETLVEYPHSLRSYESPGGVEGVVVSLIAGGSGTVFCPSCNQSLASPGVRVEEWGETGYTGGVAWGAGGREVLCPQRHELLRVKEFEGMA